MKTRTLLGVALATGLAVVAAIVVLVSERDGPDGLAAGTMLYPGLLERVNDIDFVEVTSAPDGAVSARRHGGRWGVGQRFGYPADFETVGRMLRDLARLEVIEPRTSNPDLYAKLQVEDQESGTAAASIRIIVRAGEEVLADLLVGYARPEEAGGGVFVRRSGEAQSWLAKGGFQPVRVLTRFLDRNIANVEQRRIRRTRLLHADGETVTVTRPGPGEGDWTLAEDPPEGRRAKPAHELSPLTSWLDFLIFDDVRPAAELDFQAPLVSGRFETFDGLAVEARMVAADGAYWMVLEASGGEADPRVAPLLAARKTMDADALAGSLEQALRTPEELAAEIAEINNTAAGWAYRVTDYKTGKFRTRLADVTEAEG